MPFCARMHPLLMRIFVLTCCAALLFAGAVVLRSLFPLEHLDLLLEWSQAHGLDPAVVAAVIRAESGFRPTAVSRAGAVGLMQLMPETAAWVAHRMGLSSYTEAALSDPSVNLALGTWYLRHLVDRFASLPVALMAYNAGPSNAERWGGVPGSCVS